MPTRRGQFGIAAGSVVVATFAAGLLLLAQDAPNRVRPGTRPQTAPSGNIDVGISRIYVLVPKTGLGHIHGVEGRLKSGNIELGAEYQAGELVFDISSFDADTTAARKYLGVPGTTDPGTARQVTANMLGSSVLDASKYPTATYTIASARPKEIRGKAGRFYELVGEFTLHGVKHPLTIVVAHETLQGEERLRGSFSMLQTAFGIHPFTKAFGAIGVADRLTIHGDLRLVSESAVSKEPVRR